MGSMDIRAKPVHNRPQNGPSTGGCAMAGRPELTVKAIEAAKPGQTHYDLPDRRGLALRLHPNGRKVWMIRATDRRTGERMRREMGEYGQGPGRLTLAQARTKGAEWRGMIEAGTDPAKPHGALTVGVAVEEWLKDAGMKSEAQVRRRMELHVLPTLGKRLLGEVEQRDISALLRDLRHEKKLTSEVNRVRGSLSALWTWAMKQGEVEKTRCWRRPRCLNLPWNVSVTKRSAFCL